VGIFITITFAILEGMDVIGIITVLVIILISMTIHEATHAYTAYWLGDNTAHDQGRLTFNPLAHIDPFLTIILPILLFISGGPVFGGAKPVPFNPSGVRWGEFGAMLVGVAGPLTNLAIAFICFGIYAMVGNSAVGEVLKLATYINLGFFIFNMIPIPPLDGSRVLYYLAPDTIRRGMAAMEGVGGIVIIFAIVFLFSSVISQFMVTSIEFFIRLFAEFYNIFIR
jgi:Zn-dependent protease